MPTAESQFPRFSPAEYQRRYERVREEMRNRGLDVVVAAGDSAAHNGNHANVYWLTNWLDPFTSYAVLPLSGDPFLIISNSLYGHTARRASVVSDIDSSPEPGTLIGRRLNDLGLGRGQVGLVGVRHVGRASMPYEHQRDLQAAMPEATFVEANAVLQEARLIKSAEEIAWFERGAEFTDRTITAIAESLRPGMPEYALAGPVHRAFHSDGGTMKVFFLGSTPMDDPEIIFPWQYPSARIVLRGDVLLTEISASYWGYAGQVHRPFAVGTPPTTEYQNLFEVASEAYFRVLESLKPGNTDADIRAAAGCIEKAGYHTHDVLLHGWGLSIEPPRADLPSASLKRELNQFTVTPGMMLVIQPHVITPDGKRGLQVGSLVAIEETGPRPLQKVEMEFFQVG
jgi:Xaa-Pro aminopeptidase